MYEHEKDQDIIKELRKEVKELLIEKQNNWNINFIDYRLLKSIEGRYKELKGMIRFRQKHNWLFRLSVGNKIMSAATPLVEGCDTIDKDVMYG
jgi:hypothetical protein